MTRNVAALQCQYARRPRRVDTPSHTRRELGRRAAQGPVLCQSLSSHLQPRQLLPARPRHPFPITPPPLPPPPLPVLWPTCLTITRQAVYNMIYSRSPKNPALQQLQKCSKSASTTRSGRFGTVLQQLECGIFRRTAVLIFSSLRGVISHGCGAGDG